jgi:hypothetical protein
MKSLLSCKALAGIAALLLAFAAGPVQGQEYCEHCRGHHGILGHHGHALLGHHGHGHALHTTHLHHDAYGYYRPHLHEHGIHGALGEVGANWGDCVHRYYGNHDLFYNYYVGNNCGGYGAALYVSPLPVPPHVGHTFITYQPLMPHEFMYKHHRTYHRYYNGGQGLTRTSVRYR